MKKKILSIALVLAGLMGTTAVAQSPANTTSTQQQTTYTKNNARQKAQSNPFDGLNLSEKQQAEIKALREGCQAERQKIAAQEKAEKKEMREQRKKDTQEYLAKVKDILTPEQYVQFLENAYLNQGPRPFSIARNGKQAPRASKDSKMAKRDNRKNGQRRNGQRTQSSEASQTTSQISAS